MAMKLYDNLIDAAMALTGNVPALEKAVTYASSPEGLWPESERPEMIFRSDMAYELGGSDPHLKALGCTMITGNDDLVPTDRITVIGPELDAIKGDISYARLAFVRIDENEMGEGNKLYNAIRSIEYVRYHLNPHGFMMRVSASRERECVRISKDAVKNGLSFEKAGNLFLKAWHKNPKVKAVHVVFVTDPTYPFDELNALMRQGEAITGTIDHILKNVMTDCHVCSLQEICNEVEGLRDLHFAKKAAE